MHDVQIQHAVVLLQYNLLWRVKGSLNFIDISLVYFMIYGHTSHSKRIFFPFEKTKSITGIYQYLSILHKDWIQFHSYYHKFSAA